MISNLLSASNNKIRWNFTYNKILVRIYTRIKGLISLIHVNLKRIYQSYSLHNNVYSIE